MNRKHALTLFVGLLLAQIVLAAMAAAWGIWFLVVFIIIFSLFGGAFFATTAYSVFFGAPYVPTDRARVESMLKLAGLKPGEKLVDLGSGDGRIVIAAAKMGAYAEGWEINPYLWAYSVYKINVLGLRNRAKVHLGTYWAEKFDDVDVVTLFLISLQMDRMEKKLQSELRTGSRVVSYAFTFPTWKHDEKRDGVFLYRKGL